MRSRSTRRTTPRRRSRAGATASLLVAFALSLTLTLPLSAGATNVFIDPGHGGPYPGATYSGLREADVNLWLALDLYTMLRQRGYGTRLSREDRSAVDVSDRATWHWSDTDNTYHYYADGKTGNYPIPFDDLQARCDAANAWGADVFISIHNNAAGSSARGTETYYNWDNPTDTILSERLALYVQEGVCASTGMSDRGIADVGFYVVRWSNMPAILLEGGFLSNPYDRALLSTPSFRRRMAEGIANGIDRFMAEEPFKPLYPRLSGRTRYGTAAAIAREGWPDGADTVLLASGTAWPDALAATPLSLKLDAPLLLTRPGELPPETAEVLAELAPTEIVVLGGVGAVESTPTTQAAIAALGMTEVSGASVQIPPQIAVRRLAGRNRYETAAAIAEEVGIPDSGEMVLVSGTSFADALSASSYAGMQRSPILLTEPSRVPSSTSAYVADRAEEIDSVLIVGGQAVVDTQIFQELAREFSVRRAAGPNRYATNRDVLEMIWPSGTISPFVATGKDFPDALCAGSVAARTSQPVMLIAGQAMEGKHREYLMHNESRIEGFTMVGGSRVLPHTTEWELQKAMRRH